MEQLEAAVDLQYQYRLYLLTSTHSSRKFLEVKYTCATVLLSFTTQCALEEEVEALAAFVKNGCICRGNTNIRAACRNPAILEHYNEINRQSL